MALILRRLASSSSQYQFNVLQNLTQSAGNKTGLQFVRYRCTSVTGNCGFYPFLGEPETPIIVDESGPRSLSQLLFVSEAISAEVKIHSKKISKKKVALLCTANSQYVQALISVWSKEGVAVPLCPSHPVSELKYFIQDSESSLIIYSKAFESTANELAYELSLPIVCVENCGQDMRVDDKEFYAKRCLGWIKRAFVTEDSLAKPALFVYTSGTTGRPKGVVHTFSSLSAQVQGMVSAWAWTPQDCMLHALPLHHIHGIVNALLTPLAVGATCHMLPSFDAAKVWQALLSPVSMRMTRPVTVFMGVPTMYAKLIEFYRKEINSSGKLHGITPDGVRDICTNHIRLMVSGSAALPEPILTEWQSITGHTLLERYGTTEVGMALTNPLLGTIQPGSVGMPFPGVKARITSEKGVHVISQGGKVQHTPGLEGSPGDLEIAGSSLFAEYYNKAKETAESFTADGWFMTGDTAVVVDGGFRILGRTSVDILKCGGYKISALDIERNLLSHELITDVAVVGVDDPTWGERVGAVVVLSEGTAAAEEFDLDSLRKWCEGRMPRYHVPSVLRVVKSMPRNNMGKVNKNQLKQIFVENCDKEESNAS